MFNFLLLFYTIEYSTVFLCNMKLDNIQTTANSDNFVDTSLTD